MITLTNSTTSAFIPSNGTVTTTGFTSTGGTAFTGGGTIIVNNNGSIASAATALVADMTSDPRWIDYGYIDKDEFDLKGGTIKLSGAGKIKLPDGTILELDDFGNYFLLKDKKRRTTFFNKAHQLREGQCLLMPDGTRIRMDHNGGFTIEDADAKVVYEANVKREFNRYVNASELLGDFVGDLGQVGVVQSKVLNTPIEYFINWLIHRAAEKDDDVYAAKGVPTLEQSKPLLSNKATKPQCKCCGRFLSAKRAKLGINFCNSNHMNKYEIKMGL